MTAEMNKGKLEIVNDKLGNRELDFFGDSMGNLFAAMDAWARQVSIAFDQWKHDNKWVQYLGFDTPTFSKEKPTAGKQTYFSSEELFNLFITEYNKEGQ